MARIRSVKPELWTDSKVVGLSPLARLLWMGSWNFADDYGCMPADPTQLKLRVLPADDCDPSALVAELFAAGLLEDFDGRWRVPQWSELQGLDPHVVTERRRMSPTIRRQILARDGSACLNCGRSDDLQIDHVHPVSKGGLTEPENLAVLCGPCNRRKGAR